MEGERRESRSPGQGVRAGRGDQPLRDPVIDVVDAVERPALQLDHRRNERRWNFTWVKSSKRT